MTKVKGVALLSRIQMLRDKFGQEAYDQVMQGVTAETRALLTGGALLSSSWYDADSFKDLNQTIFRVMRAKEPDIMQKLGEFTAELSLSTIHKVKVKENAPEETIKRVPGLWSAFHDTGDIEITNVGPGEIIMTMKNYGLPHREFCQNLLGWARKLISLSGGKNATAVETICVTRGDEHCEIHIKWEM